MTVPAGLLVMLIAVAIDAIVGDPPNRFHPVAWMGSAIHTARKRAKADRPLGRFLYGSTFLIIGCATVALIGLVIVELLPLLPSWLAVLIEGILLKTTLSVRSLASAATSVAKPLMTGDLEQARYWLSYHLVSRDVTTLNEPQIAAATIESVAENTSDSFVAPLFYFLIAGLPGALVYRFVNTCDAMLGYRTPELEWLGKSAARLDDALNWIPARFTALMILISGAMIVGRSPITPCKVWLRDRRLTASPNAGHPMSAAAGVLERSLEKVGLYCLGSEYPPPKASDIGTAIRLLWASSLLSVLSFSVIFWLWSTS